MEKKQKAEMVYVKGKTKSKQRKRTVIFGTIEDILNITEELPLEQRKQNVKLLQCILKS